MKRITLEELERENGTGTYDSLYQSILKKIEDGTLKPVKASKTNGKKPALHHAYWIVGEKKDYSFLEEELKYRLIPALSNDYYLKHPDIYEKERKWVLQLNDYLKNREKPWKTLVSMNERSYDIWNREKFIKEEQGNCVLKHCGMLAEQLAFYETTEPISYYAHTRETPQTIIILENKDTFYSMRKKLIDQSDTILGIKTGTLVYGAGKRILRSYQDFIDCAEPYMNLAENTILYFGDLDYEGIGIYERLAELFADQHVVIPFAKAYEAMLQKAKISESAVIEPEKSSDPQLNAMEIPGWVNNLPKTREKQNRSIGEAFFSYFNEETIELMKQILTAKRYIPQEILNILDF